MRALAAVTVTAVAGIGLGWGAWKLSSSRHSQLFGELLTRVETADSVVALTFDDGPVPGYTDSILALLADSAVRATFFVVGGGLARHPELGRRIVGAGHELGNHSYSHRRMIFKTPSFIRSEIRRTDSLILAAGATAPIHFRPPYAKRLVILPWILARMGRATILWDLEPDSHPEIARDPSRIVGHVSANVRPGSIILLHVEVPARGVNRDALPALIGALRAAGYRFVTVSQLRRLAS